MDIGVTFAHGLLSLPAALLLKSLLVCATAGLLLALLRRSSAAARHLVCLGTLAALLALPLFSLALPGWHLPVLQAQEPTPQQVAALPKREGAEVRVQAPGALPAAYAAQASPANTAPAKAPRPPAVPAAEAWRAGAGEQALALRAASAVPGGFFLAVYILGVALASARPLLGLWGIRRLRRGCVVVTDAPSLAVFADCARLLGVSVPCLYRADVPVPMTWGWRRPVVVLPESAAGWFESRLRSVLLHEMAHVRRRDWPGHRVADLACAVYWFHPLVWMIARRLRAESEAACDDLVLASGIPAPDYARHLLAIAQTLPPVARSPHSAIAMAQTSRIERRLLMLLDTTQSRRTLTRRVLLAALIPSAAALITLAVLRPSVRAQVVPRTAEMLPTAHDLTSDVIHTTSTTLKMTVDAGGKKIYTFSPDLKIDGTALFAGVTDANKPGSPWWSATGALLPTPVYNTNAYHAENHASLNARTVSLAFQLPPAASDMTVRYELPQSLGSSSDGTWPTKLAENAHRTEAQIFSRTNGSRVVTAQFPASLLKTTVKVGIASGAWKTAATYAPISGGFGNTDILGNSKFLFSPVAETKDGTIQSVATDATEDLRVVVVDVQGKETLPAMIGDMSSGDGNGMLDQITSHFSQPLSQIKEIRVQTRPFQWIEFNDVALQPVQSAGKA